MDDTELGEGREKKKLRKMRFELFFVSDGLDSILGDEGLELEGRQLQWQPTRSSNYVRALGHFVLPAKPLCLHACTSIRRRSK